MYTLAVRRDFNAQHALIGGDWGAENQTHTHHYVLELQLAGDKLNQHGFLVDIVDVEHHLDELVRNYQEKTLNDLDEFSSLNPSIEHFARILCMRLNDQLKADHLTSLKVTLWENDIAWASYEIKR
jgi:6-pyruvoyltetrahydropterin/6-carboxytetrahydropterin synthase